jgi:hypothetical protein
MIAEKSILEYLARIGRKGGKAAGSAKVRGNAEYYQRISRLGVIARKAAKAASPENAKRRNNAPRS